MNIAADRQTNLRRAWQRVPFDRAKIGFADDDPMSAPES
jgi:hypothetical protein